MDGYVTCWINLIFAIHSSFHIHALCIPIISNAGWILIFPYTSQQIKSNEYINRIIKLFRIIFQINKLYICIFFKWKPQQEHAAFALETQRTRITLRNILYTINGPLSLRGPILIKARKSLGFILTFCGPVISCYCAGAFNYDRVG